MRFSYRFTTALLLSTGLSGCASPFAQKLTYDPAEYNAAGSISISDAKVYSRQALVEERRKDLAWLDGLIDGSKDEQFEAEIVREVEQITAFAAALGLKVDPAAGLNYRRDKETGDIQQELDVLKLQLQLDQLKRDAELMRAKLPAQTDAVNPDLGKVGAGPAADATSSVEAAAADKLTAAIEKLTDAMAGRLDTEGKPPVKTTASQSPLDLFRDRAAYRDQLESARNAASLDEVHDRQEAVLVRLNFQATVVPDPRYAKSLGVVQMTVRPGSATDNEGFLANWTAYLNSASASAQDVTDLELAGLVRAYNFETGRDPNCRGILRDGVGTVAGCQARRFVLPLIEEADGSPIDLGGIFDRARPFGAANSPRFAISRQILSAADLSEERKAAMCAVVAGQPVNDGAGLQLAADLAYVQALTNEQAVLTHVYQRARKAGMPMGPAANIDARVADASRFAAEAADRLATIPGCRELVRGHVAAAARPFTVIVAREFGDSTGTEGAIRVYEVGPREQVQQVSTVARAANSLSLAASLAASDPGSGAAADAAASYSRQAMGRADARERIPAVVGYAANSAPAADAPDGATFGWVIGPQARIDPKGKLSVEQALKSYDLTADLSVPRLAGTLVIDVETIWGPSPDRLARGQLGSGTVKSSLSVPLPSVTNDFAAFSRMLLGGGASFSDIFTVAGGGPVSACRTSTLVITGPPYAWRTQKAVVGPELLDGDAISVMPDMRGILLTVPAIDAPGGTTIAITLLSPNATGTTVAPYSAKPAGGCTPAPKPKDGDTQ